MWGDDPGKDTAADHFKLWSELILKGEHMQCLLVVVNLHPLIDLKRALLAFGFA